jgi:hypothetical protein
MPMTILLAILYFGSPARPANASPAQRVFLLATPKPRVQKDCLNTLATALKTEIAHTPGVAAAKAAAAADIVVEVTECVTTSNVTTQGEVELTTVAGSRRGAGARVGVGSELPPSRTSRVTLAVERDGTPHEFTSGAEMRPLDEAMQAAVGALVAWIRSPKLD